MLYILAIFSLLSLQATAYPQISIEPSLIDATATNGTVEPELTLFNNTTNSSQPLLNAVADPWIQHSPYSPNFYYFYLYEPTGLLTRVSAVLLFHKILRDLRQMMHHKGATMHSFLDNGNYVFSTTASADEPGRPVAYVSFEVAALAPAQLTYALVAEVATMGLSWASSFRQEDSVPNALIKVGDAQARNVLMEGHFEISLDPDGESFESKRNESVPGFTETY